MAQPDDSLEELIARADKALYAAKLAGKNRVTVWQPGIDGDTAAGPGLRAA